MRSAKQRSRSKSNRPKTLGNIVNRVFDSSGPDGKVRGTPQQIIEKYQVLARDAQLSNDRVAAENFLQHSEHYTRLLAQAQREMQAEAEARRLQHEERTRQQQEERNRQQQRRQDHEGERGRADDQPRQDEQPRQDDTTARPQQDQSSVTPQRQAPSESFGIDSDPQTTESTLVETPEMREKTASVADAALSNAPGADAAASGAPDPAQPAPRKPQRTARRKPGPKTEPSEPGSDTPKPRRNTRRAPKAAAADTPNAGDAATSKASAAE